MGKKGKAGANQPCLFKDRNPIQKNCKFFKSGRDLPFLKI
jgi:hypothetical protein